jgi:hypothetical protein
MEYSTKDGLVIEGKCKESTANLKKWVKNEFKDALRDQISVSDL